MPQAADIQERERHAIIIRSYGSSVRLVFGNGWPVGPKHIVCRSFPPGRCPGLGERLPLRAKQRRFGTFPARWENGWPVGPKHIVCRSFPQGVALGWSNGCPFGESVLKRFRLWTHRRGGASGTLRSLSGAWERVTLSAFLRDFNSRTNLLHPIRIHVRILFLRLPDELPDPFWLTGFGFGDDLDSRPTARGRGRRGRHRRPRRCRAILSLRRRFFPHRASPGKPPGRGPVSSFPAFTSRSNSPRLFAEMGNVSMPICRSFSGEALPVAPNCSRSCRRRMRSASSVQ